MWTDLPCQNFHLLVCCAILDSEKQKIMEENFGFNEILKVSLSPPSPNAKVVHAASDGRVSVHLVSVAAHQRAFNETGR